MAKFDRFEDLEDQVTDYLASVLTSKCLGVQEFRVCEMSMSQVSGSLEQRLGKIATASHCQTAGHSYGQSFCSFHRARYCESH